MRRHAFSTALTTAAIVAGTFALPATANMPGSRHYNPHIAAGGDVQVNLSHTEIVRLPVPASSVVVGNPQVADVAVHSPNTLLVLGRSYGTTNLIAMDGAGRIIADHRIRVGAENYPGRLQVHTQKGRYTYDCAQECLIAPEMGDSPAHIAMAQTSSETLNNSFAADTSTAPGSESFVTGPAPSSGPVAGVPQPGIGDSEFPQ